MSVHVRRAAVAAAFALAPVAALAQGAPTAAPAPAQQAPDPALNAAQAAFEALPEPDRRAIQDALTWTGDFNGTTSGSFGRRTYDALVAYQRRAKLSPANGILDPRARAGLQAAAQRAKDGIGFAILPDPKTGARIGIPRSILSKQDVAPGQGGGTRWQSADDRITLDTRSYPPGEDLAALYDRLLNLPTPGRQVTYKFQRPDFFVLSGETATGKFYIRYAAGPAGVRGYTLGYDKALAKEFDRTVIAIANAFTPFPEAGSVAVAVAAVAQPLARPGDAPRGPVLIGSGIAVAPRRILTTADVAGCPDLRAGKARARVVATDAPSRLTLLEADTPANRFAPLRRGGLSAGEPLLVLSFTPQGGAPGLVAVPGEVVNGRLIAPLQPGASGAGAFDRAGSLAALVGPMPSQMRQIAGVVPPLTHPALSGEALAGFLAAEKLAPREPATQAGPLTTGEIAGAVGPAVLSIECVR